MARKRPNRAGAKQMFLKDLVAVMAGHADSALESQSSAAVAQHSKLFRRLSLERRRHYSKLAEEHAERK